MDKIDETKKEIEENSPTRNSGVNIDMIQKLKERRIQKIKTLEDASALLYNNQDWKHVFNSNFLIKVYLII